METLLCAELPAELGKLLRLNRAVNRSGKQGCFVANDLEHELMNKAIKEFYSVSSSMLYTPHPQYLLNLQEF